MKRAMSPSDSTGSNMSPTPGEPRPPVTAGRSPQGLNVLDSLPADAKFSISSPESEQELAHRHAKEMQDLSHRQRIEINTWWAGAILVAALELFGMAAALWAHDQDVRKAAITLVSSVFTAGLGFFVGRASSKTSS
jgi:hypothetical protein